MNEDGQAGTPASDTDFSKAFTAVVDTYEAPLLRYATRLVSDANAAQDVVQNTFIKLSVHWNTKSQTSPRELSAWLYRVTHNLAVDYIRHEARHTVCLARHAEEEQSHAAADPKQADAVGEAAERAAALLRTLSIREQQVVTLKVFEEKSYREISEITGLSEGNVGYILHYAMQKLALAVESETRQQRGSADDTPLP